MVKKEVSKPIDVYYVITDGQQKVNHQFNYLKAYKHWLCNRRTIFEICTDLDVSYPKLIKEFDKFDVSEGLQEGALEILAYFERFFGKISKNIWIYFEKFYQKISRNRTKYGIKIIS